MSLNKVTLCFFIAIVSASFFACSSDNNSTCAEPEISSSSIAAIPASSSSDVIPDSDRGSSSSVAVPSSSSITEIPSSSSVTGISSSSSADPNILWSDEFDGTALNTEYWTYETGATGWGNNELQYYTDRTDNAYVADGYLHIRAKNELFERAPYTSARLITKGKYSFTYGTVEARIALPAGKGIWPAFWMLGENIDEVNWPTCGEIDIIEAVNDEHVVYGTHHWAHEGQHADYGNSTKDYYGTSKQLDITEFHNYKMVWDKNVIAMYVDDFKYQEIDIKDASGDMGTFHKPFFFILNVAVGGTWPGFDIDDAQFPAEMLVDYIRVYK
ncbi:glycoside hydrolase family 16 protein [Fibrobacter sp. UWEL]|uniref:glycoside hydrolase family 16 protein n=1 Tax=Fibrobacter sp. UWEL TaxID=1896209 RepID=UPI00091D13FD|nr:glycoside hydrolase family 16 protein [Fibrobacter sp. UWEL]SHL30071.1 Glycosyl hydrolases family 16 [Fibrobacter sp. UWEL]